MEKNKFEQSIIQDGSFERPIIDSELTREQALDYPDCPEEILEQQELLSLKYLSADHKFHEGQLVIHQQLTKDIQDVFNFIITLPESNYFPIESIKPVILYNNDDEASMAANNTSGFNYRKVKDQDKLSYHSYGLAVDINPRQNPVIIDENITEPANGKYHLETPGTLCADHPVVKFLKERGWEWGGDWEQKKDYQHFQKLIKLDEEI